MVLAGEEEKGGKQGRRRRGGGKHLQRKCPAFLGAHIKFRGSSAEDVRNIYCYDLRTLRSQSLTLFCTGEAASQLYTAENLCETLRIVLSLVLKLLELPMKVIFRMLSVSSRSAVIS